MVEIRKYTNKSKKVNLKVSIFTSDVKIIGTVHIPTGRLTDFLNDKGANEAELFIPVTDASIYAKNTETMSYFTKFLGINKHHIIFIFPWEDEPEIEA